MSSFKHIVDQLKENKKAQDDTTELLNNWMVSQERRRLDDLEFQKELLRGRAPEAGGSSKSPSTRGNGDSTSSLLKGLGIGALLNNPAAYLRNLLLPLTGGLIAFGLASEGIRGWELNAIKKLNNIVKNNIPTTVSNGMIKLRNTVLGKFGLTAEGLMVRGEGRSGFYKAPPITEQIRMKMNALRIRTLKLFGLGPDGKLLSLRGDDNLFKKNIIGRVTFQINRLLSPLFKVAEGVGKFASGSGSKLFEGIRKFVTGPAGKLAGLVGTILRPLAFIFSAYEGIQAYINSDKDGVIAKLGDGVGGFLGSFIGAPFDLLKSGVLWILKKLFPGLTKEDGTYDDSTVAGRIAEQVQKFSFQKLIQNLVSAPFTWIQNAWDWIKGVFSDPVGTLTSMWSKLTDGIANIGTWVYNNTIEPVFKWLDNLFSDPIGTLTASLNAYFKTLGFVATSISDIMLYPINKAVTWIAEKFGWRESDAPEFNLREELTGWVTDFVKWVGGILPDMNGLNEWFRAKAKELLPTRVFEYLYPETQMSQRLDGRDGDLRSSFKQLTKITADQQRRQVALSSLAKYDTNNDGILSKKEFTEAFIANKAELTDAITQYRVDTGQSELQRGAVLGSFAREIDATKGKGLTIVAPQTVNNNSNSSSTYAIEGTGAYNQSEAARNSLMK